MVEAGDVTGPPDAAAVESAGKTDAHAADASPPASPAETPTETPKEPVAHAQPVAAKPEIAATAAPSSGTSGRTPTAAPQPWLQRIGLAGAGRGVVRLAAVVVAIGVAMRLAAPFFMDLRMDGNTYAAMGHAWAQRGDFLLPWGDVNVFDCQLPTYSHHYPPLYPLYLGVTYKILGFGLWQTKAAAVAVSVAAVAVAFACSRSLFGSKAAWLVTGVVAIEPKLVWVTGAGFSENLVLLLFTVTLWAILKGLHKPQFMLLAGLAAGLAYLTRAGMGPFFVVAGLAGLAWRLRYAGLAALRNKWYLAGTAVFLAMFLGWAVRNVALFGWPHWETSVYTTFAQDYAFSHPRDLLSGLVGKLPLFAAFLFLHMVWFPGETRRSARNSRKEDESALWLAVGLVAVIGWFMAAVYWTWEGSNHSYGTPLWWDDNLRYVVIAAVPALWIVARNVDWDSRTLAWRYAGLVALLLVVPPLSAVPQAGFLDPEGSSLYAFLEPTKFPETAAAHDLNPLLHAGDQIGVEGVIVKYSFYPYLERHDVSVYGCRATAADACPGQSPDYIISLMVYREHPGYHLIHTNTVHYFPGLPGMTQEKPDWAAFTFARTGPPPLGPRAPGCIPI